MAALTLLASVVFHHTAAAPLAQSDTTSAICALDQHDPASWAPSGASAFMNAWFAANGTTDWLRAMDQATTTTTGFDSILDCKPLGGNTCPAPVVPCLSFTPPELRLIRVAATNAHDFFSSAREKVQDTTIANILNINQIIADFAPDAGKAGFNWVNAVAAGFFFGSGASGLAGEATAPATAALAFVGSIFNLFNALSPPAAPIDNTDEWQRVLSNQLGVTFSNSAEGIAKFNSKLFGGDDDIDLNQVIQDVASAGVVTNNDGSNAITGILGTGVFLADLANNVLDIALDAGLARVKLSLVAGLLRAQNFYVHIDTTRSEGDCTDTGSRFINGQCAIISKRAGQSCEGDTEPVAKEILLKLDDPNAGYNVDMIEMYQNAIDCNGGMLDTSIAFGDALPKCFWSLPVLKTDGDSVCSLIEDDITSAQGYPAGLQLTRVSCDCTY